MPRALYDRLQASGATFYDWMPDSLGDGIGPDEVFARFVLSFATPEEDVDAFLTLIGKELSSHHGEERRPLAGAPLGSVQSGRTAYAALRASMVFGAWTPFTGMVRGFRASGTSRFSEM